MNWYDYLIVVIAVVLFVLAIIYLIKNRGCPSSVCRNCKKFNNCKKKNN